MDDIRIPVNFFFHKKTLALFDRFGDHGYVSLVRLFIFARVNRSTGDLSGIPDDQLEFMAMWKGEKGAFISALVEFGLADRGTDGSTLLHNWSKHQAWAIGAPKRSEAASVAAKAKWDKELERKINAARNADSNADGNAPRIEVASKPHDAPILSPPILSSPYLPSPNLTLPLLSTEGVQGEPSPPATPSDTPKKKSKLPIDDPDCQRVYKHYKENIDTIYRASESQSMANINSLIKRLGKDESYAGKSRSEIADFLIGCVDRYRNSEAYEKAGRDHRYVQTNFWGRNSKWECYKDEQENNMPNNKDRQDDCRDNFTQGGIKCYMENNRVYGFSYCTGCPWHQEGIDYHEELKRQAASSQESEQPETIHSDATADNIPFDDDAIWDNVEKQLEEDREVEAAW